MTIDAIALAQKVKCQFEEYKVQQQFKEIAQLIPSALQILPREFNQQIFGYIPKIFRQIEIHDCVIQAKDICFGEPVISIFPTTKNFMVLPISIFFAI
jgi:hypothetical protein